VSAEYGTGCVVVDGTATFETDTYVWPSFADGEEVFMCRHIICTADEIVGGGNVKLAPGVNGDYWNVRARGNNVWLTFSYPKTIIIVR